MGFPNKIVLATLLAMLAKGADYPKVGKECASNADCFTDYELCDEIDLIGVCEHKEILPLIGMEYAGCVAVVLIIVSSSMGGLGGGGAIIPIAVFFFGFETKQAIALSNASIFVASVYRYLFNFSKSHPLKDGKGVLVDYNTASLMLPMIMVGATLGVIFN